MISTILLGFALAGLRAEEMDGCPCDCIVQSKENDCTIELPNHRFKFSLNARAEIRRLLDHAKMLSPSESGDEASGLQPSKRNRRGLEQVVRLGELALQEDIAVEDRCRALRLIAEVVYAMNNNQRSPAPRSLDLLQIPIKFLDHWVSPVAKGRTPASNLVHEGPDDLGLVDPKPSTFWRSPRPVEGLDLYHGFGRTSILDPEEWVWDYDKAKDSYGGNPGFEVRQGDLKLKIKFGEVHSEPLTARIFHALGYYADPTDYCAGLNVRYDRRLFTEFNSRKSIVTQFKALGLIPVFNLDLQKYRDPFDYIAWALLSDGSRVTPEEFKKRLLRGAIERFSELNESNYDFDFEQRVCLIRTCEANVQMQDPDVKSIGPWDFGQLGHEDLRELRAAGLLAAWLGWCDSRFENTRVKVVQSEDGPTIRHYFSDLGGGLGKNHGVLSWQGELPNEFPWRVTRAWPVRAGELPHPAFRIVGFRPIEDTAAFREMTLGDARWMARLIAQLREAQILAALLGSGLDSTEAKLYLEKLISRRDNLIRDLGLEGELGLLRQEIVDTQFDYDPAADGPLRLHLPDGTQVNAALSESIVRQGKLIERSLARPNPKTITIRSRSVPDAQLVP